MNVSWKLYSILVQVLLLTVLYLMLRSFQQLWFRSNLRRWRPYHSSSVAFHHARLWHYLFVPKSRSKAEEYAELLAGAGLRHDLVYYFMFKRCLIVGCILLSISIWLMYPGQGMMRLLYVVPFSIGIFLLTVDKLWLTSIREWRRQRITSEIYVISSQLLYYAESRMNLHGKLMLCLPLTRKIRRDWQLLLHEWYDDAEEALRRFRTRLGTNEAYSFAETLNTLRQHEHLQYYELLRQRILDYKEQLELMKENRNESFSYVLFVLAGLPIMNTFRVFVYPWMEEGKKLFDSLN